jgi:hypothetical protein
LLVNVSTAFAAPATWGLKVTVKGALWPAGIVTGRESPPTLNTELFDVAAETVTFAPAAVRLPEEDPLLPTTTLPRPRAVGDTDNCPVAVVPVPDRGTVSVALEAVEVTVMFPVAAPLDCGANEILNVVLWPAVKVTGAVTPLKVNPVPLIPIAETVTLAPPEFVTVSDCVCVLPKVTVPKSRLTTPRESVALWFCCWLWAPVLTPWHPNMPARPAISRNRLTAFQ